MYDEICMSKMTHLVLCFVLVALSVSPSQAAKKFTKLDIVGESVSGKLRFRSRAKKGSQSKVVVKIDRLSQELLDDLDRGDVLEAWLVDEGTATDASASSSNDDDNELSFSDETTGTAFSILNSSSASISIANVPVINLIEAAPYALSLGQLKENKKGNYVVSFSMINSLTPYDYLMITQESKGNQGDYDPRPGTELTRVNLGL